MSDAPDFLRAAGRILNSGQTRTLLLTGNLSDLFRFEREGDAEYLSLVPYLLEHWAVPGKLLVVYELNGPIRFLRDGDRDRLRDAWLRWRTGLDADRLAIERMLAGPAFEREVEDLASAFDANLRRAIGNPTAAFEMLRQLCLCSRFAPDGQASLEDDLLILIEGADWALPAGAVGTLSEADRRRVAICTDWFSDPGFVEARDAVVLLSESRSLLNDRIASLPQVLEVEVPAPDLAARRAFIEDFQAEHRAETSLFEDATALSELTAGLSLHALAQLLKGAAYAGEPLGREAVVAKVEAYIQSQLGEDVVEFKSPAHDLDDVIGFTQLKAFLRRELIPRFQASGPEALPGAAVAGPIGGGKTFLFEAVANELGLVVLVLKNLRSQWFGQTDVIFERLRRVLSALSKVVIFVDEADTQFGGVGPEGHATERRLTGKIQAMMSDPALRGRVIWLLMTARIHLLSPDIRRPGRVGDLILPVLDPEGDDRMAFLRWVVEEVVGETVADDVLSELDEHTEGYSAAAFASLRSQLRAEKVLSGGTLTLERVRAVVKDLIAAPIQETRRYQTLQAKLNCTRRSLLPDPEVGDAERAAWADEIRALEARGIR